MGSHLWILPSCVCGFAYSVCGVHLLSLARRSHPDWWWWPTTGGGWGQLQYVTLQ
ncbi:hypothetical protein PF005_g33784 [Phytophthora fragariae]|uniref:Uncharacterized protein n=1 Tax=Phytophthora fragariae TaxID=53985 RepID=A0A6A3VL46_9STRA|nr:hypothetical protein PF003_g22147 [Phytophthora fragariae]KAE8916159.1 hypothetical protein PF009_g33515 [Phytophthora fragariae]KAE9049873.1 hypothetical protein PF007_g33132 [Phytophthora fragariae]KAE9053057.1 hypothetical protein PF006_g33677 [Phytophthora fragariae]KAE9142047.1 hypothetical protein PF005_g33784 [Phytophthora fragariae]